ncbi:MAG: glycosyltransferase family 4 protein [Chloroflexota bacterium]|nr:glycosyltransferase family 4 protein [Chloroflexota bacterium]
MNIVMFSITPLFPAHDMGGAQKHLRAIALHLAGLGHAVTVVCTRRDDTPADFAWTTPDGRSAARVRAILPYRQPFPAPYDVPAHDLATIIQAMGDLLAAADRFYMHDGEFLFPYVYAHVPTVVSLRDNVYPETLQGGFQFRAHTLILISDYARRFFLHTVGRFFPDLDARIRVIHNGIDWTRFVYTPPDRVLALLPFDPAGKTIIVHPHRPEENKGMWETIEVARRLVNDYQIEHLRVLVPRWLNWRQDAGVRDFYERVEARLTAYGLTENFVFHEWIPADLLPEYFSLGALSLSLGSFAESFGNAAYESYGCGTPTIMARISTHRELLPDDLAYKVDWGDHDAAARLAAAIIRGGIRTSPATLTYLRDHYTVSRQLDAVADTILNATLVPPLTYRYRALDATVRYTLAAWCVVTARGIYHDYRADYRDDLALAALAIRADGFNAADADAVQIDGWLRAGYIVPLD